MRSLAVQVAPPQVVWLARRTVTIKGGNVSILKTNAALPNPRRLKKNSVLIDFNEFSERL
jgi:hypothetical protein